MSKFLAQELHGSRESVFEGRQREECDEIGSGEPHGKQREDNDVLNTTKESVLVRISEFAGGQRNILI